MRSLLLGPLFPILLVPSYFRYRTLRYTVDDEGVTMQWGILFRREISLTFARIQDIHLTSNVIERWFGLGRIRIQTASGSASAEMTVEGMRQYEQLRDFMYTRMRGSRVARSAGTAGQHSPQVAAAAFPGQDSSQVAAAVPGAGADDELAATLREIAREVRLLREEIAGGGAGERA